MTNESIKIVDTIKEMRDSTQSGLTYQLTAYVTDVYRMREGLTLITITDGNEMFKLSAFLAGAVAFPEVSKGFVGKFIFKRKHYEGNLQGGLQEIAPASSKERQVLLEKISEKAKERYKPNEDPDAHILVKPLHKEMIKAATFIRKAIYEKRPIVLSHHGDCDGFSAALQVEVAIKGIIDQVHGDLRYLPTYYTRTPSRTPFYDIIDATKDIGFFQVSKEKNNVSAPLILIIDNGSTPQDLLAMRKAKLYGAEFIVIDHHDPGPLDEDGLSQVCKEVLVHVNPHLVGMSEYISASMLCYDLAPLINEKIPRRADVAALGAIADKCQGESVDWLIDKSKHPKSFYEELYLLVDYEIFITKFNQAKGPLFDLIMGPLEKQEGLMDLYRPMMQTAQQEVHDLVKHYAKNETWGKFSVFSIDGEITSLRGDYFSLGKLVAILHGQNEDKSPRITFAHAGSMISFRAEQSKTDGFDVNKIVKRLKEELPYARISGGGHAVAGSIRFVEAAKEEVLRTISSIVKEL